jgi:hypothetical protein
MRTSGAHLTTCSHDLNTQTVNFSIPDIVTTETFVTCFSSRTDLIIQAGLMVDPPEGKTYKIDNMYFQFTRLA